MSAALAGLIAGAASGLIAGAASKIINARRLARRRARRAHAIRQFGPYGGKVIERAWDLARTKTPARGRAVLRPEHLAWALLETQPFAVAIEALGGSPAAVETRIVDRLRAPSEPVDMAIVHARALTTAVSHEREVACADMWLALARTSAAELVDMPPLDAHALSFLLAHGRREPALAASGEQLAVVLRNDDYTTMEFVTAVLREAFGLPVERATELMRAVHERGSAVIGRYPAADAIERAQRARALAHREKFPFWISVEPA